MDEVVSKKAHRDLIHAEPIALTKRKISEETCRKWGYGVAIFADQHVQVATYCDTHGNPVAQKVRFPNKDFMVLGDLKSAGLYGQHLWRDQGKMVVITEGEIDALSVSHIQENKWPVVSVPNGAKGAEAAIKRSLDWLLQFESTILMFDMDEPGQASARKCAELFPPGKCKIANLPLKDANEMLVAGRVAELTSAIWGAKSYRPDGIIDSDEAYTMLTGKKKAFTLGSFIEPIGLQTMTRGVRSREIVTICAGTGVGKTELTRQFAYNFIQQGLKVGYIALEESVDRTAVSLVGIHLGQRLHFLDAPEHFPGFKEAWDEVLKGKVCFYDHFGSMDAQNLLNRVRFMKTSMECDVVILDHLSILVSGLGDGDERKIIDKTMTDLRSISEDTGVGVVVVSHLKRPDGVAHEEGGQTHLSQLRGSHSIGQLSDTVIGGERNQQDEKNKNILTIRVLKCRFTGDTGIAGYLHYDKESGRFKEGEKPSKGDEVCDNSNSDY